MMLLTSNTQGVPLPDGTPVYTVPQPNFPPSNEDNNNNDDNGGAANGGSYAPYGTASGDANQDNCQTNVKEKTITKIQSIIEAFDTVQTPLNKVIESTWSDCKETGIEVYKCIYVLK